MNKVLAANKFSKSLLVILTLLCAIAVAGLYYDQVLLTAIADDFSVPVSLSGMLITAIQAGYTLGLLFIVPLGDRYSRRRLILLNLVCSAALLYAMTLVSSFNTLIGIGLVMGFVNVSAQLIIPFVSSNIAAEKRGEIVGHLLTGVFLGVLLGKAIGGIMGQYFGWRTVHELAAVALLLFAAYLFRVLPADTAKKEDSYKNIIASLLPFLQKEPVLRETIVFGAAAFCAFNIFWVSLPFILAGTPYHYGSSIVGFFGFLGIAGAVAAGFTGKLTNSKNASLWNVFALAIMLLSFIILGIGWASLIILIAITFSLDIASRMNMSLNQGRLYKLQPQNHSRLNSLYMVGYYLGGSLGSWLGTSVYHHFGVTGVATTSCIVLLLAYGYYLLITTNLRQKAIHISATAPNKDLPANSRL